MTGYDWLHVGQASWGDQGANCRFPVLTRWGRKIIKFHRKFFTLPGCKYRPSRGIDFRPDDQNRNLEIRTLRETAQALKMMSRAFDVHIESRAAITGVPKKSVCSRSSERRRRRRPFSAFSPLRVVMTVQPCMLKHKKVERNKDTKTIKTVGIPQRNAYWKSHEEDY